MNLSRLMFLSSLVSLAGVGPRLMGAGTALDPSDPGSLLRRVQEAQVQLSRGGTAAAAGDPQLDRMLAEATRTPDSPESAELAAELRSIRGNAALQSPVLAKLAKEIQRSKEQAASTQEQAWAVWMKAQAFYEEWRETARPWLWRVPVLLSLAALGLLVAGQHGRVRALCETGYGLSLPWLTLLAWGTAGVALLTRSNPWPLVPGELLLPPIAWMAASAVLLRAVDLNYPVWNSLLKGAAAPLVSMGACLAVQRVAPLLPL